MTSPRVEGRSITQRRARKALATVKRPDAMRVHPDAQRLRLLVPLLQHHESRPQRRPQPKARAAERDGDDGLERVGEAVDDHAQRVVAQREQ